MMKDVRITYKRSDEVVEWREEQEWGGRKRESSRNVTYLEGEREKHGP